MVNKHQTCTEFAVFWKQFLCLHALHKSGNQYLCTHNDEKAYRWYSSIHTIAAVFNRDEIKVYMIEVFTPKRQYMHQSSM